MTELPSIALIGIAAVIAVLSYLAGMKISSPGEKRSAQNEFDRELLAARSRANKLKHEMDDLNRKMEKYLQLFVKLPEIVKNINTNLSYDELIAAVIRMTKTIIDTDIIELYIFDSENETLKLEAGLGTGRSSSVQLALGEGMVGSAAELNMLVTSEQMKATGSSGKDNNLLMAAPINFKRTLLGAIAIGPVKTKTGNEKRFLAMVADLAGIAIKNSKYLTTAKQEAITDALTGLFNRRHFFDIATEAAQRASSYESPISIFIFDIDNFKHYNDTNGHTEGDTLLKEMGSLLKEKTRSTNVLARYGGEEFIVLLRDCDKDTALMYAENIRKLIESHPFNAREKQPMGMVSVSGGVASYPNDATSVKKVVDLADKALYHSKSNGKNQVTKYELQMGQ